MKIWIFVILSLSSSSVLAQLGFDDGLKKTCEFMGGEFKQRENSGSIQGDTCDLKFKVATRDEADAIEFCELYAPWRLRGVKREGGHGERQYTVCQVEATLTCLSGWMQMFGYCFKMPKKPEIYTYEEAKELCANEVTDGEKGEIAYMHHRYIVGVWRRFFAASQIWVHASESFTSRFIQKTGTVDGDTLALAFTGRHFNFMVHPNSLIKIDPNVRLQALCQYKPHINPAEINYLGRRYSEIYYPVVPVDNGFLLRSASSYTRKTNQNGVCENALKPFLTPAMGNFIPDENTLRKLDEKKIPLTYMTRASAAHKIDYKGFDDVMCNAFKAKLTVPLHTSGVDYLLNTAPGFEKVSCDHMLSTGITHIENKDTDLKLMSDSRSLPIWCKLGRPTKIVYSIPSDGYEVFLRANGEVVAHKLFLQKVKQPQAKEICKKDGAFLSGVSEWAEHEFMKGMAMKLNIHKENYGFWVGGTRRESCRKHPSGYYGTPYTCDPKDECSRANVYVWMDGVSNNFDEDWWQIEKDWGKQPNFQDPLTVELAMTFTVTSWADPNSKGFLDDVHAGYFNRYFFCQKKLKFTIENIE